MRKRDMIRINLLILALCNLLFHVDDAVAQNATHTASEATQSATGRTASQAEEALKDCPSSDPSCSAMVSGIAAIAAFAFAPRSDGGAQRFGIAVAPMTLAEPATRARLQILVGPQEALPKNSFVRIRGLPPAVTVPQGHAITAGAWAVPLIALPNLMITLPDGLAGWSEVAVTLVAADGTVLAETKTKLVVALPSQSNAAAAAGSPPWLTPEDRDRALQLHAQGMEQLEIGNIVVARKFFERAAEADLAQSVMALAGTYDPDELAKLGAFGPRPDVEAARKWYRKARDLGAPDAGERLRRLGAR